MEKKIKAIGYYETSAKLNSGIQEAFYGAIDAKDKEVPEEKEKEFFVGIFLNMKEN